MNNVILKGNLARDPDKREVTANGRTTSVVNFTIAVSRFFNKADGTRDKDVTFINCEAWDTGAETIAKYLKKGDPILIKGSLKTENWEQDGQKRSKTKVRVERFEKLYRAPARDGDDNTDENPVDDTQPETANVGAGDSDGEDIPF